MARPHTRDKRTRRPAVETCPNPGRTSAETHGKWDRHTIAGLSDKQLEAMSCRQLIDLIRASEHPWADSAMRQHLEYADRQALLRLAFLERRCCQNAAAAAQDLAAMDELDGLAYRREAGTLFGSPR